MTDLFETHRELMRTFRFYIALTVFANLGYAVVLGLFVMAAMESRDPLAFLLLIVPGMVSTGFAALSAIGIAEAIGLHRAIQSTGATLGLPHVTRSLMLPVQTTLHLHLPRALRVGCGTVSPRSILPHWPSGLI